MFLVKIKKNLPENLEFLEIVFYSEVRLTLVTGSSNSSFRVCSKIK